MIRVRPHLTRKYVAMLASSVLALIGVPALLASPAGAASSSVDFSQCANSPTAPHDCSWINGALQHSNSVYAEGMSTLQRLVVAGVPSAAGNHHSLLFHTSFTKGGLHSYDFLTSWDQAVAAAHYYQVPFGNLNPCVGVPGTTCTTLAATAPTNVTVPDDAFVSHDGSTQTRIDQYETLFGDRSVSLYANAAVSGATLSLSHVDTGGVVANGADTGDTDISWTLSWTGAASDVMLTFGAHVAKGVGLTGWGAKTGASSISGAPYHVSLDTLDGASLGSQDNQMMGTTVVVPGILTVNKVLSPASDPGTFDLQVAGTSYATGVGNGGTTGQLTFPPGSYDVGELAASGTNLANYDTSTDCTDTATGNSVASGTGHSTVSVTLVSEQNVVCTITNTRAVGKITVNKSIAGDPVGTSRQFSFDVDCPGSTWDQTLTLDLSSALSGSVDSGNIPTGTVCTVTEGTHALYSVTVSPTGGSVTVPGHVDFTNTRDTGVITVNKSLVGDPVAAQTAFTFHVDCPGTAYDQDVAIDLTGATAGSGQTSAIPTGMSCTVTEGGHSGWSSVSVPADGSVTVPGSVDFTNTRDTGVITVSKTLVGAVAGASTVFRFDVVCPSATSYNQVLTLDAATPGTVSSSPIPTGVACSVVEEATAGWQQSSPAVGGVDVTVPGQAAFTNTRLTGQLQLAKSVAPALGSYTVGDPSNTLTYTLSLSPTGALDHTNVSVTDYIPGYDPADTKSGKTTYVAGSATCSTGCSASYDGSKHLLTWAVGSVAHDASAVVMTFKVTIDRPAFNPTVGLPVETIDNVGFVQSLQQDRTPSNQVKTPVTAVLGVKVVRTPKLPFTGLPAKQLSLLALLLLVAGGVLSAVRRRES